MTWLCPDTEQAASSLALLRGLASQVRTGKPQCLCIRHAWCLSTASRLVTLVVASSNPKPATLCCAAWRRAAGAPARPPLGAGANGRRRKGHGLSAGRVCPRHAPNLREYHTLRIGHACCLGLFRAELCAGTGVSAGVPILQALDAGDDGPLQQMELDLLVGCGSLQPSAVMASCLAGAFIVWDGRLVVDAQFCSSDPDVMGAGPLASFSRCAGVV